MSTAIQSTLGDDELREVHLACALAITKSTLFTNGLKYGIKEYFGGSPWTIDDDPLLIDMYRTDFLSFVHPAGIWEANIEFDAVSDKAIHIQGSRWESNWHVASSIHYRLLLNDIWDAILGNDDRLTVRHLRGNRKGDQALQLMGELTLDRLVEYEPQLRNAIVENYDFELDSARAEIDREFARALHNRSLRGLLPAKATDAPQNRFLGSPDNEDVRDLCHLLLKNADAIAAGTKTQADVSRELTRECVGNDPNAQNLLRQARRFRHLWDRSDK